MSEPKKWNRERTRCLLRFGRTNSGPWDWDDAPGDSWQFGDIPDEEDVDLVIAAPEMLEFCKRVAYRYQVFCNGLVSPEMYADYREAIDLINKATGAQEDGQ